MIPSDPLYALQWHFDQLGMLGGGRAIEQIWDEYSGAGVRIGVYDEGVQYAHPDLDGNYDPSLHYNGLDGANRSGVKWHGTVVAGLIASERNGIGGVGVAWGATITSVNYLDPDPGFDKLRSFGWAANFDIMNNSWGNSAAFTSDQNLANTSSERYQLNGMLSNLAFSSRFVGGFELGTVVVQSAGNTNIDANRDGINATWYTITVGAVGADGFVSQFSDYGACLLVSASGGPTVTTDLLGADGLNSSTDPASDYTDLFIGTSASAPIVSGVIALMLEANPLLSWRDVQNILSYSAVHTGSAIGSATPGLNENNTWFFNAASNWNGGGAHFSEDYGYGLVDVHAAVRMAEVWSNFGAPLTRRDVVSAGSERLLVSTSVGDANPAGVINYTIGTSLIVEHVELTLGMNHARVTDLRIWLVSPGGTETQLFDGRTNTGSIPNNSEIGFTWRFGADAFHGEDALGQWQIKVQDAVAGASGGVHLLGMTVSGAPNGADDVFHYTDEFLAIRPLDPGRGNLADPDGGVDWFNGAALTGDVALNLLGGSLSTLNGHAFIAIAAGTLIEHAALGGGDDTVTGNAASNRLLGQRGDDLISGGALPDYLFGGVGRDTLNGQGGVDRQYGGLGDDVLRGGARNDLLYGESGNDRVIGDDGDDRIYGRQGADALTGGVGADTFYFAGRADSGVLIALADRILDFDGAEGDRIDLTQIDADPFTAGNQVFVLTTGGFTTVGQALIGVLGANETLSLNLDNDAAAEMLILVAGNAFSAGDVIW